jgi:hypothetical protein
MGRFCSNPSAFRPHVPRRRGANQLGDPPRLHASAVRRDGCRYECRSKPQAAANREPEVVAEEGIVSHGTTAVDHG